MTKKHFEELARILSTLQPEQNTHARDLWGHAVSEAADLCATINPRFQRYTFYDACGL